MKKLYLMAFAIGFVAGAVGDIIGNRINALREKREYEKCAKMGTLINPIERQTKWRYDGKLPTIEETFDKLLKKEEEL